MTRLAPIFDIVAKCKRIVTRYEIQDKPPTSPQVTARQLENLGFIRFVGTYCFPLDRMSVRHTRQHVTYCFDTDAMTVWNFSRYMITENPTLEQIKRAISPIL